ncbi:PHD finger protein 7-like [Drosophila kikkawai]|uniref:PHD finger protein 7-like n=1 Tax=Drosophila kikkawai TaxID=30033 RepID=A0A6P4IF83_DROKI|nr:PHD finger protein 7-like [Drosophila kikkawai]
MDLPCVLCCSKDDDELVFGEVHKEEQLVVHRNCLYLSSNLVKNGNEHTGILSFLKEDILMEVRRCHLLRCFYCQRLGANIGCCRKRCRRTFHTKCGYGNLAVSQFSGRFNSYCHKHIPEYRIQLGTAGHCVICFESCLQKYANSAGYSFKCPLCNDKEKFAKVALFGISIQNRDASWELEPNAFADLMQRAEYCILPDCRIRPSATSAADLLYCILCASNPMHTHCTFETASTYRCDDCIVIKRCLGL